MYLHVLVVVSDYVFFLFQGVLEKIKGGIKAVENEVEKGADIAAKKTHMPLW